MPEATECYAEALAKAYLGLDRLHRQANPDDAWGLVVLKLGQPEAEPFEDFDEARERFTRLQSEATALEEPDRQVYYHALCGSALAVIEWNLKGLSLKDQIKGFLAAPPYPASESQLNHIAAELHRALGELGYSGDLSQRVESWEERHRVVPEGIEPTMHTLIVEARLHCEALVGPIRCPDPKIKLVAGAPFNARCDFANRTIEINPDPVLTIQGLKHLVMHEVFPGHCLQFELRERAYQEGWGFADGLLSLVKSAGSPLFEGLADLGAHTLGWETPDDRVQNLLTRYRVGLGTVAAWGLHKLHWKQAEAESYLRKHSLSGGDGWVYNRLAYISPKGRGAHVWSYWLGEAHLRPLLPSLPDKTLIRKLYGRMHSLDSVRLLA